MSRHAIPLRRTLRLRLAQGCVVLSLALCASCGSGSPGIGQAPFDGKFVSAGTELGPISFTINGGQVAGTGTLIHNSQVVQLAVFGTLRNGRIEAAIQATGLGFGTISGQMSGASAAAGTFTYTDLAGLSVTDGSWNVLAQ